MSDLFLVNDAVTCRDKFRYEALVNYKNETLWREKETLSVAWGPVKEVLLEKVVVWFGVGSSVVGREGTESCCDKKQSLFRYTQQIKETER
jgi:hypothetical protein